MLGSAGRDGGSHQRHAAHHADGSVRKEDKESPVFDLLQQILSASESDRSGNEGTRDELIAVARKYSQAEFCQEPVLRELVQVITRKLKGLSPDRLEALEKSVTATLYEDQTSLARLQRLWSYLTGASSNAR